jgi:hypothetical protein
MIRGTPLRIQLFLIFYGLPYLGIRLSPMLAAVIGLAPNFWRMQSDNPRNEPVLRKILKNSNPSGGSYWGKCFSRD